MTERVREMGTHGRWRKPLLVMLVIASALELSLFNIPFWGALVSGASPAVAFPFNPLRALLAWGILVFCYAFRPRGPLMRTTVDENPRLLVKGLRIVAVCAMAMAFACTMLNPWYLGISAFSDTGPHGGDEDPVWYNDSAQREYDELADAMIAGRTELPETPPEWLSQMDDPYDTNARDAKMGDTGEEYYWDAAYYNGHYYVYFGAVPCLIFFVPFHLLTGGAALPTGIPIDITLMFYMAGMAALVSYAARRRFPRARVGVTLVAFMGALTCSGLLLALMLPTLYQIPATTSLALIVWGFYFWLRACEEDRTGFHLAGSVCIALVMGCRPPLAAVALFGIFPLVRVLKRRQGRGWGLLALLCPFCIVAGCLALYNAARFGSPLDFGAAYNLTAVDFTKHAFAAENVSLGLYHYLFQRPALTTTFPFLDAAQLDTAWSRGVYIEGMAGGVLASFPFLWMGLLFWLPRRRNTFKVKVLLALAIAFLLVVFDTEFGGIVGRYQLDFSFLFAFVATFTTIALSHDASLRMDGLSTGASREKNRIPGENQVGGKAALEGDGQVTQAMTGVAGMTTMGTAGKSLDAVMRLLPTVLVLLSFAYSLLLMMFLMSDASFYTGIDVFGRIPWLFGALQQFFQFWG